MSTTPTENPALTARRAALNLLARREHSFHELLEKLAGKYPDFDHEEVLLPVVQTLRDEKLQSDERFAESWVRYRSSRGFGPLKIAAELQPRRLERDLVRKVLYFSGPDWEQRCVQVLHDKFRLAAKPSLAERQKWQRFLLQRGFSNDQIRSVFKTLHTAAPEEDTTT